MVIWIVSKFFKPPELKNGSMSVSVILSVYNEEKVIRDRIQNIAEQEFDFNSLEMIIGSDASNDNTNQIITSLRSKYPWLKFYNFSVRRGKAVVLNDLVEKSKNEILVFTDANSCFQKDAIKKLVEKFSQKEIGGVSGRLILKERNKNSTESNEERRYWEYETRIKKAEGRCGTLIGANGGIYALRRNMFLKIPANISLTDDLYLTLSVLKTGNKFYYAENAIAYEDIAPTFTDEFYRKIRFSATNFQTLRYIGFGLKGANILANFCYLSHKILRWFIPVILIFLPVLNLTLYSHSLLFQVTAIIQLLFIFLAFIGFFFSKIRIRILIFSVPFFFLLTNLAIALGLVNFLRGKQTGIWNPTPRNSN